MAGYKMLGLDAGRLGLLEDLAALHYPPFHAIVGLRDGWELLALCEGVRRACRRAHEKPLKRVRCFHWVAGYEQARYRLRAVERRQKRRHCCDKVTRWTVNEGSGRAGWEGEVKRLVLEEGAPAFGLLVHLGEGRVQDIAADLSVFLPMVGAETIVVLARMDMAETRRQFDRMTRIKGWDGVWPRGSGLGLLQRPMHAKEKADGNAI